MLLKTRLPFAFALLVLPLGAWGGAPPHFWSQRFGDAGPQQGWSVATDASGNVVMSGNFSDAIDFGGRALSAPGGENVNIFLVKFDPNGNHLWSQSFGDGNTELTSSVAVDASENIVWTGHFGQTIDFGGGVLTSTSVYDMFLAKFDPDGIHVWSESYGNTGLELSTHVAVDASGNVVVAGRFNGTVDFGDGLLATAGGYDTYLVN